MMQSLTWNTFIFRNNQPNEVNLADIQLPPEDQQYILTTTEDGQQVLVDNSGDVVYQVADDGTTQVGLHLFTCCNMKKVWY